MGIDSLPVEEQKDTMEKLGAIVYQETMIRVLDTMSEEDKDAFEKLIESNPDPEKMFSFLSEKVPDISSIVSQEAQKLKDESSKIMDNIGK